MLSNYQNKQQKINIPNSSLIEVHCSTNSPSNIKITSAKEIEEQERLTEPLRRQILYCQNKNCREILSNHFVTKSEINQKQKLQIKCWKCGELNNY